MDFVNIFIFYFLAKHVLNFIEKMGFSPNMTPIMTPMPNMSNLNLFK